MSGSIGPRAGQGGYDYIVQGMAGWMSLTGDSNGPPTKRGLSLVDFSAGYASVLALLGGLWRARRDGIGCDCDVSLFETALAQLTYVGTWTATGGFRPRRLAESAHPSIVPFQAFATADGWIVVACAKQKFWERLCHALGRPELLEDDRFTDFAGRDDHREELLAIVRPAFSERGCAELIAILSEAGVPVSRSRSPRSPRPEREASHRPRSNRVYRPARVRCASRSRRSPRQVRSNRGRSAYSGKRSPQSRRELLNW